MTIQSSEGTNQPGFDFGLVPDGLTSVRYEGRSAKISGNSFVMDRSNVSVPPAPRRFTKADGTTVTADPLVLAEY